MDKSAGYEVKEGKKRAKGMVPPTPRDRYASIQYPTGDYSTVTDLAKFLGWSTSVPLYTAT